MHEGLITLVTDARSDRDVPHFGLDAVESLADFLVSRFPGRCRDGR